MLLEHVRAEQDPRELDRVAGAVGMRHRAHERLVGVPHVRVDHVEVPLVDGKVDRLADGSTRVVQPRSQVGQLDEVAKVLDRPVAASVVEIADKRRAVRRCEDRVPAPEDDVVRRVAGELRELRRRGRLHQRTAQAAREADALAVDLRPGAAEQGERIRRAVHLDPDLLEDGVGVLLDGRDALLGEHLERSERTGEEREALDRGGQARSLSVRHVHRSVVQHVLHS